LKIVRFLALIMVVLLLPSCDGDSPAAPAPGPTPTAANVTLTVTVLNANTTSANSTPPYPVITREACWTENWGADGAPAVDGNVGALTVTGNRPNGNDKFWFFDPVGVIPAGGQVERTRCVNYESNATVGDVGVIDSLQFNATGTDSLGNSFDYDFFVNVRKDQQENVNQMACTPDATTLCLNNNRFKVTLDYRGDLGSAPMPAPVLSSNFDSGFFFFFDDTAQDLLVQILDACNDNDHHWVFYGSLTNVEFDLTVTDTVSGQMRTYENDLGQMSPAITDTTAFATCPGPLPIPDPDD